MRIRFLINRNLSGFDLQTRSAMELECQIECSQEAGECQIITCFILRIGSKIITNQKNWMESTAINQLKHIVDYKGVIEVIGLPDLHVGVSPVGIAVIIQEMIYPYLISGDIGCGMGLFHTGIGKA